MRESAVQVGAKRACRNRGETPDGAYVCFVQYVGGPGIQRKAVQMGNDSPLRNGVLRLLPILGRRIAEEYKHSADASLGIERFMGLSVIRYCVRDGHDKPPMPGNPDVPRTERVKTFAFTRHPETIISVQLTDKIDKRRAERTGITPVKRMDIPGTPTVERAIQLPLAADDDPYEMTHAVLAPSAQGRLNDGLILLHHKRPEEDHLEPDTFLETIVDVSPLLRK